MKTISQICLILSGIIFLLGCYSGRKKNGWQKLEKTSFEYSEIRGIGFENGVTRRDPSDIISIGDTCYIYYTKVYGKGPGYWGTVWYARSTDKGFTWREMGEALGKGSPGSFDSFGTFTPNIFVHNNIFYLYYTGVKPTPGRPDSIFENNSHNDITAIGVATSADPDGPFIRLSADPILEISDSSGSFDSYRVDDAALIEKQGKILLYYKGRNSLDGIDGPSKTWMGVAVAEHPGGPFLKHPEPVLPDSHEVLVWPEGKGIAALASKSSTLEFAPDGLDFTTHPIHIKVENRPNAPGIFRPDLSQPETGVKPFSWGISMVHNGDECYLVRFSCNFN